MVTHGEGRVLGQLVVAFAQMRREVCQRQLSFLFSSARKRWHFSNIVGRHITFVIWSDAVVGTGHTTFQNVAPTRFDVECQYCIEMTVAYNRQTSHREPSRRCNPLNRNVGKIYVLTEITLYLGSGTR